MSKYESKIKGKTTQGADQTQSRLEAFLFSEIVTCGANIKWPQQESLTTFVLCSGSGLMKKYLFVYRLGFEAYKMIVRT